MEAEKGLSGMKEWEAFEILEDKGRGVSGWSV
jgi:hypothetical protein